MKKFHSLLICFCIVMLYNCTSQKIIPINKVPWLIGTWENHTARGKIYETWTRKSDHELSGKSYALRERDTIVFETIRLVKEKENLFYIPLVKNQNDGQPVRFASKLVTANEMVFENLQHDFPQTISYKLTSDTTLVAEISGTQNGQDRKQTFSMRRKK